MLEEGVDKAIEALVCIGIIIGAQWLAVAAYRAWWDSETGGAALPESTIQLITFIVSLGVSWAIVKVWPDE